VPARDGPASLLLRAGGIVVDPDGGIDGTVQRGTFEGDRVVLEIAVAGSPTLEAHVPPSQAPPAGTPVRVTITPRAVVPLTLRGDVPSG